MKTRILVALLLAAAPVRLLAARSSPEVHPPQRRQMAVAAADQLAQVRTVAPLPADLVSPFAPPDFDKPDPAELQAAMLAAQRAAAASGGTKKGTATVQRSTSATDRETLEKLAAQIQPSGAMQVRGAQRLLIGGKAFEVGTRFTATYNNLDYELELVAIDRTTFTLRYRGEDITRPIKTVR